MPQKAREIDRAFFASRDAPVLEAAFGPKAQASLGYELGLVSIARKGVVWRQALWGLVALEDFQQSKLFPPHELWRGLLGLSLSVSFEDWAKRCLGEGSAFELNVTAAHESDHASDQANPLPPAVDEIQNGGAGNSVTVGAAVRRQIVRASLGARLYNDGDFTHGALGDLAIVFGRAFKPFFSLHAESLQSRTASHDLLRVRAMAGVAFAGKSGVFAVFGAFGAGNGYGLLINQKEQQWSFGVRLSAF